MGYVGYAPAAKPLTSADITDSIITSAKITDATIVNGDIANATIALAKLSATGTPSATTFLRGDNSWVAAGGANTPAFRATMSSGTSLPDSTFTKLTFNTETYDTDSCYDTTNYRFTPTTSGKYLVIASVNISPSNQTSSTTICSIYKNGSEHSRANIVLSNSTSNPITVSLIELNGSTDYVEAFAYQGSGATRTSYTGAEQTYFSAFKLIGV